MRSRLVILLLLPLVCLPGLARQDVHVVPTDPLTPDKERAAFRLPPGYEAQLVASEPDIQKPLNLAFDDEGRLWVTDTVEYPYAVPPGQKGRDTVKILSDFAPDGKARKIVTFADDLSIPIGLLPLPGHAPREALVFSIPRIYRLKDGAGKNAADKRDPFYATFQARDTHGMTNGFFHGFDGWIYACHGYANRSEVKGADGQAVTMESGNTYRMKADGSHLEQFTWGQVNPFGLAMDPLGYLYSSDCHSEPIYQLIREGYYPSFGKPHDGLGFAPTMFTGYKGSTAVCGISYYAADAFPKADRGTAFVGDVVTNQVVQFRWRWDGASPKATAHPFLDSADKWFRPVDIKLGPDGAIYIADFYNRIIGHYEVPLSHPGRDRHRGRIWRVVYTGGKGTPVPNGGDLARAPAATLAEALGHPNLTVRLQATQQLAQRGDTPEIHIVTARAFLRPTSPEQQVHAMWVLERLGALTEPRLKQAAGAKDEQVRVHAARVLSERRRWSAADRAVAVAGLADASAHVQRASADALGQHADAANVRPLLDVRHKSPAADTHLLHVVRVALRNQLRPARTWETIKSETWSEKDARALADVALGVHTGEAATFLLAHVKEHRYPHERLTEFVHHVARHGTADEGKALVALARGSNPAALPQQAALLQAVERGTQERGGKLSSEAREWGGEVTAKLIAGGREGETRMGLELIGQLRLPGQDDRLTELATADKRAGVRLAALTALANLDATKHAATLGKALTNAAEGFELREQVANLLGRANLPATRAELLTALPTAPARLQNAIAATLATSPAGGEALLTTIASGKASARLLRERVVVVRLELQNLPGVKERLAKLTEGLPSADAKMDKLLAARRKGYAATKADAAKGAAVYEKHCGICHQLAGKGAKVGPQLDGIGIRGLERLLEDTLDSNRNVDQAFRSTSLVLLSGKTVQGLLLREEGEVLVLADNLGKEVRVSKKDVDQRSLSPLSPMPANFDEQIPEADFYHLMAYLLAQKPGK